MSNTVQINCPRCGASLKVALSMGLSSQRCDKCGNFLYSADTGHTPAAQRRVRKQTWRSIFSTARSQALAESVDPDSKYHDTESRSPGLALAALGAALVAVGLTYYFIGVERKRSAGADEAKSGMVVQTSLQGRDLAAEKRAVMAGFRTVEEKDLDPAWVKLVSETARNYLTSVQVGEIIKLTRNSKQYEAEITKAFANLDSLPLSKTGVEDIVYSMPNDGAPKPLALLFFNNRLDQLQGIVLTETPQGMQVDWPSLSGCGDMTVAEFLKKKPTEPTLIRVAARLSDYFNFDYQANQGLQALRMTEYPEQTVLYGYVKKDSELSKRVANLPEHNISLPLGEMPPPRPLTIRAHFRNESKSPNQVEIDEIQGNGWFVP